MITITPEVRAARQALRQALVKRQSAVGIEREEAKVELLIAVRVIRDALAQEPPVSMFHRKQI